MKYTLLVQPEAEQDAALIVDGLEAISSGLGLHFLNALDDLYGYLEHFSLGFQERKGEYRHGHLRRFPYRVTYMVEGEVVYIYQVRHTHRKEDPEFGP